jgi:hypothetical protein
MMSWPKPKVLFLETGNSAHSAALNPYKVRVMAEPGVLVS